MRNLFTLLLLLLPAPAVAATDLDYLVEKTYNVRYSEVKTLIDGGYKVHVIWYDADDRTRPIETLCSLEGEHGKVEWVEWGTLGEYLKWHRDVSEAAGTPIKCE